MRPHKEDPNHNWITVGWNRIYYPGDTGTNTTDLELVNLIINIVLSRRGAKFVWFYIKNFYLGTPLDRPEYANIRLSNIPQESVDEYNLTIFFTNGLIYFNIRKGVYGLPQSGRLANN